MSSGEVERVDRGGTRIRLHPDLLRERARADPRRTAIRVVDYSTLTFERWHRQAQQFARQLAADGIGSGRRVGLLFDNAHLSEYAIAVAGTWLAGAACAPLSRLQRDRELREMVAAAELDVIVHGPGVPAPVVGCPSRPFGYDAETSGEDHGTQIRPDDVAEILFTSGSTAAPRAIAVTHRNLAQEQPLRRSTGEGGRTDVTLHSVPLGTNWAQTLLRSTLRSSSELLVLPRFGVKRALELIEAERPTIVAMSPATASMLVDGGVADVDVGSVRRIAISSAPSTPALLRVVHELFPEAAISVGYTSTEAWPAYTALEYPPDPPTSVGRPGERTEVRVVDADGRACRLGDVGSVQLRHLDAAPRRYLSDGRSVASGDGGWIATGDLGYLDGERRLTLKDRGADVINVGGSKVYCPEVEDVLIEHPMVRQAAVFGAPVDTFGEEVVAAIVTTLADTRDLERFVSERLAPHKVPTRYLLLKELPLSTSGKVSKRMLREGAAREGWEEIGVRLSVESAREHLLEVWREVLQREDLAIDEDLLEAGATSFTSLAVIARMRGRTGYEIPTGRFLSLGTVDEQARLLGAL